MNAPAARLLSTEEAVAFARATQAAGRVLVFTNGVFDILHPGHVRYLRDARALGDLLVVAVNSDRSVQANKGPDRPINPELERAELLLALDCVDAAVLFDEDTPHRIITLLQPEVLVKGADWPADNIVGRDVVQSRGGQVVRVTLAEGHSTTDLIARTRALRPGPPSAR